MTFTDPPGRAFVVAAGSITGADHLRLGRDGQDGLAVLAGTASTIAVVTDGCSSPPVSEVGARLGAVWLAHATEDHVVRHGVSDATAGTVHGRLLRALRALVRGAARDRAAFIADYLLFTYLVAVVDEASVLVFGVGDGAFAVDARVEILDAGEENMPAYAGYALLPGLACPAPVTHVHGAAAAIHSVVIATDGASHLLGAPDLSPSRVARNPSLLRKALLRARDAGEVLDDATCVAIVRPGSHGPAAALPPAVAS